MVSQAAAPAPKRARKINFKEDELILMIREVTKRKEVIIGPLSTVVTKQAKNAAWEAVADAVNSIAPTHRQPAEIRKKFQDFRSQVKKKLAAIRREMNQTGKCAISL